MMYCAGCIRDLGLAAFVFACFAPAIPGQTRPNSKISSPLSDFSHSVHALTERISPAVVQIIVSGYGTAEESEDTKTSILTRQRSTGSGVVIDPEGYIVTNAHVVRGAVRVRVLISHAVSGNATSSALDPDSVVDAKIVGVDRGTDLALIKIDRKSLPVLAFGDSDSLRQGEIVLAIGSPLGLKNSVSMGVVSAPARQISEDSPLAYIQTDASINPGNSGGALINVEGQLVGINSFIYSQSGGSQGIGFAIPSNVVQSVCQQLKQKGHVHRGEVGVFVQDITPVMAAGLKLPSKAGVIVSDVEPGSPAETAGLKPRDILVALDDKPIEYAREFELVFFRRMKGDKVSLKVMRDGKPLESPISIEVSEREGEDDMFADSVNPEHNLVPRLGILCVEIDSKIAKMVPELRQAEGLIVAAKSPDGQGRYLDLQAGDVIHNMNDQPVETLEKFQTTISELKSGSAVVFLIERSGSLRYVAFELE